MKWFWITVVLSIILGTSVNLLFGSLRPEVFVFLQSYWRELVIIVLLLGLLTIFTALNLTRYALSIDIESENLDTNNRNSLLNKVRAIWIDGRLNQSLYRKMLITLGLNDHPGAVEQTIDFLVQRPNQVERSRAPGTKIIDIYDELGGEMLILGAPGAGKTTLLLELTRDLLDRAIEDTTSPIPVVFPLSSWAEQQRPIEDWLVDELQRLYGVRSQLAKKWLAQSQILPLLDGLDEMPVQHRASCIDSLNAFRQVHGLFPLVVSSRAKDYEAIQAPLRLQGAAMIQPLTREQVEAYLVCAGLELQAIHDDDTWWEWDEKTGYPLKAGQSILSNT